MSPITTHVLDTAKGCPAQGLTITLKQQSSDGSYRTLAQGKTNSDGRITDLLQPNSLVVGTYQMHFDTGGYFRDNQNEGFYPEATITFTIKNTTEHYHIPLLLSPYGYTTYRGS